MGVFVLYTHSYRALQWFRTRVKLPLEVQGQVRGVVVFVMRAMFIIASLCYCFAVLFSSFGTIVVFVVLLRAFYNIFRYNLTVNLRCCWRFAV